jgi:ABC-type nitrate/sulfonate/bicarbonate transport system substrate-binding protein
MTLPSSLDRRRFLQLTAGGLAGIAGASLLGACGSSATGSISALEDAAVSAFPMNLQLSWLKTVEFGGSYMAETKGYYAAKKVAVSLTAGGPDVDPNPLVANGKAFVGLTGLDQVSQAINQGAPLKVVGVLFQKNPFCVVSRADNPITKPTDLYGKKIGVAAGNSTAWNAFLKLNKLDVSKITVVPAQFDPTPVATGEYDGQVVFIDNEVIQLQEKGLKTATMLFEDFNYHLVTDVYIVNTSTLSDKTKRAALVRFLQADLKGWQDALANPAAAAALTVDKFGKGTGLDLPQQVGEAKAQVPLISDAYTKAHGLGFFTAASLAPDFKTLAASGIKASADFVDASVIQDVYQGKTTL